MLYRGLPSGVFRGLDYGSYENRVYIRVIVGNKGFAEIQQFLSHSQNGLPWQSFTPQFSSCSRRRVRQSNMAKYPLLLHHGLSAQEILGEANT